PKVMAHELGHSLSLMHLDEKENLMSVSAGPRDPKTWIKLNDKQIVDARKVASEGKPFRGGGARQGQPLRRVPRPTDRDKPNPAPAVPKSNDSPTGEKRSS